MRPQRWSTALAFHQVQQGNHGQVGTAFWERGFHGVHSFHLRETSVHFNSFIMRWVFPKIGVPQNGWFTMENPIKMDDSGVPPFLETLRCFQCNNSFQLGKRSIKRSCSLIFWGRTSYGEGLRLGGPCPPLMLTLSCIKNRERMKFSYIVPMSCIEFQKSSEVFLVLYLNRSFRKGFCFFRGENLGSKWASSAGSHVAGGKVVSYSSKKKINSREPIKLVIAAPRIP